MLIMCFPDYYSRFKMDTIVIESDPYIELYKYYKKCIESAKKILYKNAEMKAWHENIQKRHSSLSENTNYGFCGLLYQLLQFEPFKSYMNVNIGTDTSKERVVRNISILSAILGKFEFIYLILRNPCVFKENRHFNVRSLCIFPCFCPYEPKQGKLFV